MNAKEQGLRRIQEALERGRRTGGRDGSPRDSAIDRQPPAETAARIRQRNRQEQETLLKLFQDESRMLLQKVTPVRDGAAAGRLILDLLLGKAALNGAAAVAAWADPLLTGLGLREPLRQSGISFFTPQKDAPDLPLEYRKIGAALAGITTADYALAETGTLALLAGPHKPRAVFLLPGIHIVVLRIEQFIRNLAELYALLGWMRQTGGENPVRGLTLLSGVSRTGDIEAVPVFGAHGPKEVHIYVLLEPRPSG